MPYLKFTEAEIRILRDALVKKEQSAMLELKKEKTGALHKKYNAINDLRKYVDECIEDPDGQ